MLRPLGKQEHDHAICWGHWQPLPEQDVSAEVPVIELMGFMTTQEKIRTVYNNMYQLKRASRAEPCNTEMAENICQEIFNSVKECLWHRWGPTQPEEEPEWGSPSASRLDPQSEFWQRISATYKHFRDLKEGSCEKALAVASDSHRWVLVAMAFLKGKIERLSHSINCTHWWSGSHWCSHNHWHSCNWQSCSAGHYKHSPSHEGDPVKQCAQSSSPTHPWWQVTFEDPEMEGSNNASDWDQSADGDSGPPPSFKPDLEHFLGRDVPLLRVKGEEDCQQDYPPKPSPNDNIKWVVWRAEQVNTPWWWWELSADSSEQDTREFARKVRSSFEQPQAEEPWPGILKQFLNAPGSTHPWQRMVPATPRPMNGQPRLSPGTAIEDLGICQSTTILGRKGTTTHPHQAVSFGRKHFGTEAGYGTAYNILGFRGPKQQSHSKWSVISVTAVKPAPKGLFLWPAVEDDGGLVWVISLRPPHWPLPLGKPYSRI